MSSNAEIWKMTDRRRRRYLAGNVRIMSIGLTKAIQPILDSIETYSDVGDVPDAVEKLKTEHITEAYRQLYTRTAPEFANRSFSDIKKKDDLPDVWFSMIERYIESGVIADRITQVSNTTKNRVRSIIQKGIDQGLSVPDIARDIDKLGLDQAIRNRSTVIARTETINASNKGSMMGAEATGLDLWKVWIATADPRTREDHTEADGQQVDQGQTFRVGWEDLEYPGDPAGSAGNVIQCRCAVAFEPK